jgi:rhomboid protease GluP
VTDPGELPSGEVEILRAPDPRLVKELSLVLNSVGIRHRVVGNQHQQWILTSPEHARAALEELSNYHRENVGRSANEKRLEPYTGSATQALIWAVVLCLIHVLAQAHTFGLDWRRAGAMDGAALREGELWRPFTALCLHADVQHLVSNLFFGALFIVLLHQVLGPARTWLAVLLAGAAGNLVNALVVGPDLRSLGASTAVFAALGTLTAFQFSLKQESPRARARRWLPLVAGVLLLGWNGMGGVRHDPWTGIQRPPEDNTDIGAHVAGFLCGLLAGAIVWKLRERGTGERWTTLLLWLPPLLLVAAWTAALLYG